MLNVAFSIIFPQLCQRREIPTQQRSELSKLMKFPPQAHLPTWPQGKSKLPAFIQRFLPVDPHKVQL